MAESAITPPTAPQYTERQNQTLLVFAHLMEGGREDDDTVADLGNLTKLLDDDVELSQKGEPSVVSVIDADCVDTMLCYHDMRQPENVRSHATLCTSAYLKAAGEEGTKALRKFFMTRMKRSTYDDYIVAFCVATAIFPIVPDFTGDLFLHEGFLYSLGSLMQRKWKSRKVETACLEMLSAACMYPICREAVRKYCIEWLEVIAEQDTDDAVNAMRSANPDIDAEEGSISMRRHCKQVQNLAALVLLKLWSAPKQPSEKPPAEQRQTWPEPAAESKARPSATSIEALTKRFTEMLREDPDHVQHSVEGLAYATIQPKVREKLSRDGASLKRLVEVLGSARPKSPLTYGALSIFVHVTAYQPVETEEQKRLRQLKAYANAAGKLQPDPLNDDAHVGERCRRVFEAGITPVLVTHCKHGSVASLSLIVSIISSLSVTPALRGPLAQQGAVRLLMAAWAALPDTEAAARRRAAQALARILISTNPALVFRQTPQASAVRPLVSILAPDPDAEVRDLLPTFESLLALTNLASTDNDTRRAIVRAAWDDIEELLFSTNTRVSTAAAELVCNIVQSPAETMAIFGDGTAKAGNRIKVMLALADAEDEKTRSAAGGALASLSGYDVVVRGILAQPRGAQIILELCRDQDEGLRHRGAVTVQNMVFQEGEAGKLAREKLAAAGAVEALTDCVKKTRSAEVVQTVVQTLEVLLGDKK